MTTEPKPYAAARAAYDEGSSVRVLRRRFHMTDGELRDTVPEEFPEEGQTPEGDCGY